MPDKFKNEVTIRYTRTENVSPKNTAGLARMLSSIEDYPATRLLEQCGITAKVIDMHAELVEEEEEEGT